MDGPFFLSAVLKISQNISQLTEFYYYFLTPFIPEAIAGPSRLTPAQQPAAPFVPEAIAGPSRLVPAQPSAIAGPSRLALPEPVVDEPVLLPRARSRSPVANRPRARSRSHRRPCSPPVACPCPPSPPPSLPSPPHEEREGRGRPCQEEQVRVPARSPGEGAHKDSRRVGNLSVPCTRPWRENPALRPTRRARSPPPSDHQMAFMPDTVARRWRMEPQPLRRFPNVDR
ncbi:hypothetical protein JTE90_013416 [Oedothorax gibbosus]|uniref:Uncharacterized protein n=1 Tax=Oedothorax gibbosus TaxID=931172 RepID=A0AAV6TQ99_9ARAC|nr:hypothetical protein JTE90_013416 [Oedothorax gibbosus]